MKGHIYKRAKDSWTMVYDLPVDMITGKRRQKTQSIRGTKREAERTLRDLPPKNEPSFMLDWKLRKGALNGEKILHAGADYQQAP